MKIFISYSRADAGNFASHIHGYLIDNNHAVFTDVNSITIGDPWARSIEENIFECDIFVVILTPDSLRSSHVEKEVLQAQKEKKIIVPCKHQYVNYNQIKWGLENIQGIEFSDKYELALNLYAKITNYENLVQPKTNNETNNSEEFITLHKKDRSLSADNKYKEAIDQEEIEYHDKTLMIDPNNAAALIDKGNEFYNQHKLQEALDCYDKALRVDPNHIEALRHKGSILFNQRKYQEALEYYDKVIRIDPNHLEALMDKGSILFNQRKYKEAIKYYDKVIRIDPNYSVVQDRKIQALEELKESKKKGFFGFRK